MKEQSEPINKANAYSELQKAKVQVSNPAAFPIAGIGASAGGLEALEQFFVNMPVSTGMAFVVIQHLDPNHKGIMCELLQRFTAMTVHTVTDRMKLKPNSVYVIPPNKSMSVLNGVLHLFSPVESRGLRLPVDFFFRSLAEDQKHNSIGIVLSGMGSDGSVGLKAIKEKGGIAAVQDPDTAKYDSMPRSAIESVLVDIVAAANQLPAKLLAIAFRTRTTSSQIELAKDSSSLEKIIILLRAQTGNDFSQYKKSTVYRRIERRMDIHQISKISTYVRYLQENPAEIDILFKELLIGVTGFFRDSLIWEHLKDVVLPNYFDGLPKQYVVRAWVPACSTGEEAFTLAVIFREALEKCSKDKNLSFQIFATDLDSSAIDRARKAVYPPNIESDVSPNRLSRFFVKTDENQYRVNSEIREMVVFATQNVIKDPPFTKLDVLSCRNLLIYIDSALQKNLLALFHYSIIQNGILLLGSAETNSSNSDLFSVIDSKLKIYQRTGAGKPEELFDFPGSATHPKQEIIEQPTSMTIPENVQNLTDSLLLQQFAPASVLVTAQGDILYITGSTGKFLEPAAGKANMNIFAMAREGLRNELSIAFRKAIQNYEKIVVRNVRVGSNGVNQLVDVSLQKIVKPLQLKDKILIVFEEVPAAGQALPKSKTGKSHKSNFEQELQRVNEELQSTREEMQTSQEELKSTNEELKSTNEELQSTNEELQSTNEELTTSKEEMQSLNEELHTVNAELQSKVEDISIVNNDMKNLLNSIEIATLFLDREMKIRQFTVPATKIFKLIRSDVGRLFTDQANDLDYPELYNDAKEVLRTLIFIEKPISTFDGRWYNIRIMPYRTLEDKIDGVVITFVDITKAKQLEKALKETMITLRSFIQAVPSIILGLSSDGSIIEYNSEAEKLFGPKHEDVINRNFVHLFIPESSRKTVSSDIKKLISGTFPNRFECPVKVMDGTEVRIEWSANKLLDEYGQLIGAVAIGVNISKA